MGALRDAVEAIDLVDAFLVVEEALFLPPFFKTGRGGGLISSASVILASLATSSL